MVFALVSLGVKPTKQRIPLEKGRPTTSWCPKLGTPLGWPLGCPSPVQPTTESGPLGRCSSLGLLRVPGAGACMEIDGQPVLSEIEPERERERAREKK